MIRTSTAAALSLVALLGPAACNDDAVPDPGGPCGTCAEIYSNGGIVCAPTASSDAWQSLDDCACGAGPCGPMCAGTGNLCATGPANVACSACIATSCAVQVSECAAN
jgi:hypothetical protein